MHIFFTKNITDSVATLGEDESLHAIKVMRLKKGSQVNVTSGDGKMYLAEIDDPHPKHCTLTIVSVNSSDEKKNYRIHLAIAPTKNTERIEWFIEKAIEIGVDEISFLICDHSERDVLKSERAERVAVAAMKQSQKATLPKLNEPIRFHTFLKNNPQSEFNYIAYVDKDNSSYLSKIAPVSQNYTILIGPEGDFSAAEISLSSSFGYKAVSLGNSRLRTETAGIMACSMLNIVNL